MANPFETEMQYPDYAAIQRKRKMAEMLMQQGGSPLEGQMVSGHYVSPGIAGALAKGLQIYYGQKGAEEADTQTKALAEQLKTGKQQQIQDFINAVQGKPEIKEAPLTPRDDEGNVMPAAIVPAVKPDFKKAFQLGATSDVPMLQQAAGTMFAQQFAPKQAEGVVINGQLVNKFTGQPMGQAVPKQAEPFSLRPGEIRYGADGKPVATSNNPNQPFNADGTPNQKFMEFEIAKRKAGAQQSTVNVNTATKPFLNEVGKGVGEAVTSAFTGAQSAAQTINNVNQMREGLKTAIVGPMAGARIKLSQIGEVLGIGGKDAAEQLQNTRAVMQGLARQEMAAAAGMKGQGQITESERAILRKAESGNIDELTKPEIETLLNALTKTAQYRIGLHNQNMERLKRDPNAAGVVDYMKVDIPSVMRSTTQPNAPQGLTFLGFEPVGGQ